MDLLALAIAPGIAISLYIYFKDKYNKEPLYLLVLCFFAGILSTIPAVVIQLLFTEPLNHFLGSGILFTLIFAYVLVAVSEEGSKYIMLRILPYKRLAFDEPFDGIVYAVMVGMGFATAENIGYVYEHGFATGVLRMFLSVPAHATFAILMGYYLGLAKFYPARRTIYYFLSFFLPVLFHGTFDFFLFAGKNGLHFIGALASFFIAIKLSTNAIKRNQKISEKFFNNKILRDDDNHSIM